MFLSSVKEEQKREDSYTLLNLMGEITQAEPHFWSTIILGFGEYRYKNKTGIEGYWFFTGLAPRKQALTLYLMCGLSHDGLDFTGLGKYKLGKKSLKSASVILPKTIVWTGSILVKRRKKIK